MGPSPSPAWPGPSVDLDKHRLWQVCCRCRRLSLSPEILGPAGGGGDWNGWMAQVQPGTLGEEDPCWRKYPGP